MKEIPLSGKIGKGKAVMVDDEDFQYLSQWKWNFNESIGYAVRTYWCASTHKNKKMYMHQEIMLKYNPRYSGYIDHINQNKLDNRKQNLRSCSNSENNHNKGKFRGEYTSHFKGVSYYSSGKRRKRWVAKLKLNYKVISLGYFFTEIEAALAYNKKAIELFGEFACLNEITE